MRTLVIVILILTPLGALGQGPDEFRFVLPFANTNPPNKAWADELVRRLQLPLICDPPCGGGGAGTVTATGTITNTPVNSPTPTHTTVFTSTLTSTPTTTATATATVTTTFTPYDAFSIVDPDNGTSIVAEIPGDTLNVTGTDPVVVTGDGTTDTLNIALRASHTFTITATATETPTVTITPTSTVTATRTSSATATATATSVSTATSTVTPTFVFDFGIVDPPLGTNPEAETLHDTLNITVAGDTPLLITGDSATDTVNFDWDFSVANTWTGEQTFDAGIHLNDNDLAEFGTGTDATISYDGTDLLVNTKLVGTGIQKNTSRLELLDGGGTFTTPANFDIISTQDNYTIDIAAVSLVFAAARGTVTWEQDGAFLGQMAFFGALNTHKNPSGETRTHGIIRTFLDGQTWEADTTANTIVAYDSFVSGPSFTRINGGTLSMTLGFNQFNAGVNISAGVTLAERTGFNVLNPSNAGTLTTNIGADIEFQSAGATNIGLRNQSTEVDTPVVQNITAVGNAITVTTKYKTLTSNAGGFTLTSAPTIADGVQGQIVDITNVDTADTVTIQDQGTLAGSNLRLGATTRALAPRDSIRLKYDTTVGDWVEERFNNVL